MGRTGLVLGAGGLTGGAFHAGVLAALEEATGWDPRDASVIVGTSAGAVTAASLRAGLSASDLLARAEGRALSGEGARLVAGARQRPAPPLRPATTMRSTAELATRLARAARRPLEARPLALLAGLVPPGTVGTDAISEGIAAMSLGRWPDRPLWVCAVREGDGRRVVFGRDEVAPLPDAVAASCAIPGFFAPMVIGGRAYVDGGVHSPTNADVLAVAHPSTAAGCTLVLVISPMSAAGTRPRLALDEPARRLARLTLASEARRLRRAGARVLAIQPTTEDVAVMGPNPMDPRRRRAVARQARESTLRRLARADTQACLRALHDRSAG